MSRLFMLLVTCLMSCVVAAQEKQVEPAPLPDPAPSTTGIQPSNEDSTPDTGAENTPTEDEMTKSLHDSITLGLEYLAGQQVEDGSFGRGRFANHVGITSLATIAFMSDGHVPGRGTYARQVEGGINFILSHATETGLIAADTSHGPMYGHGFATLLLGEVYGMTDKDDQVRLALEKAVDLIVRTQNKEGGWRYQPMPSDADVSVTICQVMALRSARNAGIKVPVETIDRAIDYVKQCQNEDGGWRYMLRTGSSAWPRTAAGIASLFYAGVHEDESIEKGLNYLEEAATPGRGSVRQSHYYYGQYYAVQAMYMAGGDRWTRWWPAIREELIHRQSSNGGWLDHHVGGAYASSMALIILQMPKRYLPIFQR